jgi:hypothetical protein
LNYSPLQSSVQSLCVFFLRVVLFFSSTPRSSKKKFETKKAKNKKRSRDFFSLLKLLPKPPLSSAVNGGL